MDIYNEASVGNQAGSMAIQTQVQNFNGTSRHPQSMKILDELLGKIKLEMKVTVLLPLLSAVDQEQSKARIPAIDFDKPENFWIVKNIDYQKWVETEANQVLWLSGPSHSGMSEIAAHTLRRAAAQEEGFVLCFFMATAPWGDITKAFTHTLLQQIINQSPETAKTIAIGFLSTLLCQIWKRNSSPFQTQHPTNETLREILEVATPVELWQAFGESLQQTAKPVLCMVIDGIQAAPPEDPFEGHFCRLVKHLMGKTPRFKALLTSDRNCDLSLVSREVLHIEHNKERAECLKSLAYDDTRYEKVSEQHDGTLDWLWTHPQYQKWLSESSSVLYINGKPGSGKSTLVKYFKENHDRWQSRTSTLAYYFYSHRGTVLEHTHENMLRSLLKQILEHDESTFYHFQKEFRTIEGKGWSYIALKELLLSFKTQPPTKQLYLIIDAMDEAKEGDREEIIRLMFDLATANTSIGIKIFIASRPLPTLLHLVASKPRRHIITLQEQNREDIGRFAHTFLQSDLELAGNDLREATDYILQHAQGVFVWVSLTRLELRDEFRDGRRDIMILLRRLPTDLEQFYQLMFDRIQDQTHWNESRELSTTRRETMFKFVLCATRPLKVVELYSALAYSDHSAVEGIPVRFMRAQILRSGGHFLEINDETIQLMHQTARTFLLRSPHGTKTHSVLATCSINYLQACFTSSNLDGLTKLKNWESKDFEAYISYLDKWPFLCYALANLRDHYEQCDMQDKPSVLVSQLVGQLFKRTPSSFIGKWIISQFKANSPENSIDLPPGVKFRQLYQDLWGSKDRSVDFKYQTLNAAAACESSQVAKAILTTCNEHEDRSGKKTPLMICVVNDYEAAMRLLLTERKGMNRQGIIDALKLVLKKL